MKNRSSNLFHSPLLLTGIMLGALGCTGTMNPSFPLSMEQAKAAIEQMEADPMALQRPLIVVAGYGDAGIAEKYLKDHLSLSLRGQPIVPVAFGGAKSFAECRDRMIEVVDEHLTSDDPDTTAQVDVVANSMGGLVAVYAAAPDVEGRRLRIARLFTISTPFSGADIANVPFVSKFVKDMRPRSQFIAQMQERLAGIDYQIIPYVRLDDTWVGANHTGPLDTPPWWVPTGPFTMAHLFAYKDPRFHADILRRLRGQTPFTIPPPAPLPISTVEWPPAAPRP
jgi:pimeloyl-ACP methyl ester carboxylesterase